MIVSCSRNVIAALLALCLIAGPTLAASVNEGGMAIFTGRVMQEDGIAPREGVTVVLFDDATETEYRSDPSGVDGSYSISAPPGAYVLIVETDEGAYLAADSLQVTEGANKPLSLTLNATTGRPVTAGAGLSTVGKGVIAGVIVVVAVLVIDELTKEKDASDFEL